MRRTAKTVAQIIIAFAVAACGNGCGAVNPAGFPNQVVGAEGRPLVLDEIEAIVQDNALTDEEKREELRGLGLEDEKLIEALLSL